MPARQGLRGHHLLAGVNHAGAGAGIVEVEPHQVPPSRHSVAHTAVAGEGGWLDQRTAQVEQHFGLLVIEEATADAWKQGHGAAAAVDDREIGNEVAGQIGTITAMGPSPPDFKRGPGMPTQSPLAS